MVKSTNELMSFWEDLGHISLGFTFAFLIINALFFNALILPAQAESGASLESSIPMRVRGRAYGRLMRQEMQQERKQQMQQGKMLQQRENQIRRQQQKREQQLVRRPVQDFVHNYRSKNRRVQQLGRRHRQWQTNVNQSKGGANQSNAR